MSTPLRRGRQVHCKGLIRRFGDGVMSCGRPFLQLSIQFLKCRCCQSGTQFYHVGQQLQDFLLSLRLVGVLCTFAGPHVCVKRARSIGCQQIHLPEQYDRPQCMFLRQQRQQFFMSGRCQTLSSGLLNGRKFVDNPINHRTSAGHGCDIGIRFHDGECQIQGPDMSGFRTCHDSRPRHGTGRIQYLLPQISMSRPCQGCRILCAGLNHRGRRRFQSCGHWSSAGGQCSCGRGSLELVDGDRRLHLHNFQHQRSASDGRFHRQQSCNPFDGGCTSSTIEVVFLKMLFECLYPFCRIT